MSRANADLLDLIHGLVASSLKDELVAAAAATDEKGNRIPINPQLLDKALKFLKDNSITAPASNRPVNDLANELAGLDVDLDAEAMAIRH